MGEEHYPRHQAVAALRQALSTGTSANGSAGSHNGKNGGAGSSGSSPATEDENDV